MNLLGHAYVAAAVIGHNSPWLLVGSELPDIVPFLPQQVFSFSEIHEGFANLLPLIKSDAPYAVDMPLAALAHSVSHGADAFNSQISNWLLNGNDSLKTEIATAIADCSGVSHNVALVHRLHNYLWVGVDIYLLKNKPEFIVEYQSLFHKIDFEAVASVLAKGFGKDEKAVYDVVTTYFSRISSDRLGSFSGLLSIWKEVLAGLPEKDEVDLAKTEKLFEEIYERFGNQWPDILDRVVKAVALQMIPFLPQIKN